MRHPHSWEHAPIPPVSEQCLSAQPLMGPGKQLTPCINACRSARCCAARRRRLQCSACTDMPACCSALPAQSGTPATPPRLPGACCPPTWGLACRYRWQSDDGACRAGHARVCRPAHKCAAKRQLHPLLPAQLVRLFVVQRPRLAAAAP